MGRISDQETDFIFWLVFRGLLFTLLGRMFAGTTVFFTVEAPY